MRDIIKPAVPAFIRPIDRRRVLKGLSAAGLIAAPALLKTTRADAAPGSLFSLGVASGDPLAQSCVLWTRLAPDPLNGGGMGAVSVQVQWEIATDQGMANVIASGAAPARAVDGHTIHVTVGGLQPDSWYYYRFSAMGEFSRIGRTRTLPRPDAPVQHMRCGLVSCQNFTDGFFTAYKDLALQDLDFVLHVGDYIYESGASANPVLPARNHTGGEIFSVTDYRNRYALYRLDQHLQDAHARFPFICTPDDHEVDNNYAGTVAEETAPFQGAEFLERRANAYQVYSEMMPLLAANRLKKSQNKFQLYREFRFGLLANIFVLDTRQFRTDQPAQDGFGSTDPDSAAVENILGEKLYDPTGINDPNATMMGAVQETWLANGLKRSRAGWNVIAQQVMVTPWNLARTARLQASFAIQANPNLTPQQKQFLLGLVGQVDSIVNVDAWDGYAAARARLLQMISALKPNNPIVLSGDIHSAWAANLLTDFTNPNSDLIAAEFVGTSITSTFASQDPRPVDGAVRAGVQQDNKHIAFFDGLFRGYCICDVDTHRWQTTYRAVGTLADTQNPSPLALTPMENSTVEDDAVIEIKSGFARPNSGKRLEVVSARIPLS